MDFAIGQKGEMMNDSLVSRQAVKDIMFNIRTNRYNNDKHFAELCLEEFDAIPSTQPEIKTDGDTISRRVAIDAIMSLVNFDTVKELRQYCDSHLAAVWSDGIRDAIDAIEDVDFTQPERKTGRWIDDHCSECGQYVFHEDVRNFCPNCGAKMLKEGEE